MTYSCPFPNKLFRKAGLSCKAGPEAKLLSNLLIVEDIEDLSKAVFNGRQLGIWTFHINLGLAST
jgi:hypothetical protein